ncbi:MAG: hypothetical protein FJ316_10470 [SAR202 cluster bacterium]|nr:hypothetical protein [SAR202 cluster bacterium]
MAVQFQDWHFSEAEQQKYRDWMARILVGHTGTKERCNQTVYWTPLAKPLSQCTVTLFTTGGVHRKSDRPFDVANPHGDPSFREIPTAVETAQLMVTHTHYNHVDADRDVNCMFPLDRLRELCDAGVVGGIAPTAYSIMGFNPDPTRLAEETAPELARRIKTSGADIALMTCG